MGVVNLEGKKAPIRRQCPSGILEDYLSYCSYQESPEDFHLWVCISMVAIALGRDCYVNWGAWQIFPNLYVILVGESALTHKSTAIRMGISPMKKALPELNGLAQKMSPEALSNYLSKMSSDTDEDAVAFMEVSELSVLIGKSKLDDSLLKLLTDLWDSPDHHSTFTIGRGQEEIENCCLNMIAGTTPDWLKNSVPVESLEGGFFSRLILVQRPPTGKKNAMPMMQPRHHESLARVQNDLQAVYNMSGEFTMTDTAIQMYKMWYMEHNHPEKAESFMRGYFGRKGDFIIKISMCLSAMFDDSKIITDDYISFAIQILNENEAFTKGIVKYMGTTEDGGKYLTVRDKIRKSVVTHVGVRDGKEVEMDSVGITHTKLMRSVSHKFKAQELAEILEGLVQAGDIEMKLEGRATVYLYKGGK
ncbi:YfjI family protein [bacterium]|nr:YfjI family protein [bacterium]